MGQKNKIKGVDCLNSWGKFLGLFVFSVFVLFGCSSDDVKDVAKKEEVSGGKESSVTDLHELIDENNKLLDLAVGEYNNLEGFDVQNSSYIDSNVIIYKSNERSILLNWRTGDLLTNINNEYSDLIIDDGWYYIPKSFEEDKYLRIGITEENEGEVEDISKDEYDYFLSFFGESNRYDFEEVDDETLKIVAYDKESEERIWDADVTGHETHLNTFAETDEYFIATMNSELDVYMFNKKTGEKVFEEERSFYYDAYQDGDSLYLATAIEGGISNYQIFKLDTNTWEKEKILDMEDIKTTGDPYLVEEDGVLLAIFEGNIFGVNLEDTSNTYELIYNDQDVHVSGYFDMFIKDNFMYILSEGEDEYVFNIVNISNGEVLHNYYIDDSDLNRAFLEQISEEQFVIYRKNGVFELNFSDFN